MNVQPKITPQYVASLIEFFQTACSIVENSQHYPYQAMYAISCERRTDFEIARQKVIMQQLEYRLVTHVTDPESGITTEMSEALHQV